LNVIHHRFLVAQASGRAHPREIVGQETSLGGLVALVCRRVDLQLRLLNPILRRETNRRYGFGTGCLGTVQAWPQASHS